MKNNYKSPILNLTIFAKWLFTTYSSNDDLFLSDFIFTILNGVIILYPTFQILFLKLYQTIDFEFSN